MMEDSMSWYVLNNKEKIIGLLNYLISKEAKITIQIKGEKTIFTSKFIEINYNLRDASSKIGAEPRLIIERMTPDKGNTLIQSVPYVSVGFAINENYCKCLVQYVGIINTYPYFGFIMNIPEDIEIKEKRREERVYQIPEVVSAEVRLGNGTNDGKVYNLSVSDCSRYGLGLLIAKKDAELLQMINRGDTLNDITCFTKSAMMKVHGTVRHKTKIEEGRYKGCYIIGIESPEIIEGYKPDECGTNGSYHTHP